MCSFHANLMSLSHSFSLSPPSLAPLSLHPSPPSLSTPFPSQPSLLALSLLALELQEQHDHEHVDKLLNAFQSLQQQLTVSVYCPV